MPTITERIRTFNANRLEDMLRIKYELMRENPFRFYRGSCHLFNEDLSRANSLPASPLSWICGDLHMENFGTYKGDNRLVYFDLNDFDEALLAPVAYELIRAVCSIFLAFDSLKIEEDKALKMGQLFLKNYAQTLSKGKSYYIEPQTAQGIVRTFLTAVSARKQKQILRKRTVRSKDSVAILMEHPRHFDLDPELKRELTAHMTEWIRSNSDSPNNYEVLDAAFRLAGTGSIGLKRYLFLLKSVNQNEKYMLVEMKQASPSSLQPYLREPQPAWETEARRIVSIQRRMQNIPPALLSDTVFKGEPFLIQEMQPNKDSFNFKLIRDKYRDIYQVISDMALLTASSQIRSSGWKGAANVDGLSAFGDRHEQWQESLLDYARNYTLTVKNNYEEFCGATLSAGLTSTKKEKT